MEGIEKIVERIAEDTRAVISSMQAETAEKCRIIEGKYNTLAQEEYWKAARAGVAECERQVQRLSSTAALESKKSILAMKQDRIDHVFEEAVKRICELPDEQYINFLAKLASDAAETGTEEIVFNERDKAGCAKEVIKEANSIIAKRGLSQKLTVASDIGGFAGGIIVRYGMTQINCTAEKLVELMKDELTAQVADILFGD